MSVNPYESPKVDMNQPAYRYVPREDAQRSLRIALLIMLVPAVYNFACFSFALFNFRIRVGRPLAMSNVDRAVNSVGFVLIALAVWFLGLSVLEFFTLRIHYVAARASKFNDWKDSLYLTLRRAPFFAFAGAGLWAVWVCAFYQLRIGFYEISVPIGIAAHLLAACFYLPLFWRWYHLEFAARRQLG